MRNWFRRHPPETAGNKELWVPCSQCRELVYAREWESNYKVCPKCGHHARLSASERIALLLDPESFEELDAGMRSDDPLQFAPEGVRPYKQKLEEEMASSGLAEAAIYGRGRVDGLPVVFAMLDFRFFVATMGSVVGEKIARAAELAAREHRPLIICSASGGARQHEGVIALMQMAKTVAAVRRLGQVGLPYISIMTDPTTAGVTASFAALGDIIIAEPQAYIGFAGLRVIEQTTGEKLPPGTDTAEFQQQHGMLDLVVHRRDLREVVARLLRLYMDARRQALARSMGQEEPASVPAAAMVASTGAR